MKKTINVIIIIVQFVIIINFIREVVPKNPPVARVKSINEYSSTNFSELSVNGKLFKREGNDLIYQDINTSESYTLPPGYYFLFEVIINPEPRSGKFIGPNKFDLIFVNIMS